jgi:hypothetical protein
VPGGDGLGNSELPLTARSDPVVLVVEARADIIAAPPAANLP